MSGLQKSECPVAAGQIAKENENQAAIVTSAGDGDKSPMQREAFLALAESVCQSICAGMEQCPAFGSACWELLWLAKSWSADMVKAAVSPAGTTAGLAVGNGTLLALLIGAKHVPDASPEARAHINVALLLCENLFDHMEPPGVALGGGK